MVIERYAKNPVLAPNKDQSWEAEAVFNGCPARKGGKIFFLYRAVSLPHYHSAAKTKLMVSDIGIAESRDGMNFSNRRRLIVPEYEWERFGCEDPRITKLNGTYYVFYTAVGSWPPNAESIRVGIAISKNLEKVEEKHLVTPFNAKAMALFPERIGNKLWAVLTINTDRPPAKICLAPFDKEEEIWQESRWKKWYQDSDKYSLPLRRRPQDHIEVGTPPIKTKYGWLLFYSSIRDYFSPQKSFGVEAVLLKADNPLKIIARTDFPILSPEEYYEKHGMVPNVVFPSGATTDNGWLNLYYGAADTTCCLAKIELNPFLEQLLGKEKRAVQLNRAEENPILGPVKNHPWEAKATFNPAAIYLEGKTHLLYRAMSEDNTSVFGYASSRDGIHVDHRSSEPVYVPREKFEQKLQPGGNSGAEDPRLVKIGGRIHLFYTAFDGKNPPRVALSSIAAKDFLDHKWNWERPVLISPPDLDDKDAALFPEKIGGKYLIIHRSGDDIDLSFHKTLDFDGTNWLEEYRWIRPRKGWWDSKKVGVAAPPIKTAEGWVLLYHGVSDEDGFYRVGAVLADRRNPLKIIGRTDYPILEPEAPYEKEGIVANVVFPCGAALVGKDLFVYYGGADKVVGAATVEFRKLLKILKLCRC